MSLVHPLKDFAFAKASSYEVVCWKERRGTDRKAAPDCQPQAESCHEIVFTFKFNCPAVIQVARVNGSESTCTPRRRQAPASLSGRSRETCSAT